MIYLLLGLISWNLSRCLTVTGGGSVGECYRLNEPLDTLQSFYLLAYLLIKLNSTHSKSRVRCYFSDASWLKDCSRSFEVT